MIASHERPSHQARRLELQQHVLQGLGRAGAAAAVAVAAVAAAAAAAAGVGIL